ncbi:MAG: BamA/TamA family outer membrane protein [Verrucomicrobiales bacterium]|nr:BamA/TamA family outer membrane protein [Verrucomicrobiales bacterium]
MPIALTLRFCFILLFTAGLAQSTLHAALAEKVSVEGLRSIDEATVREWLAPQLKFVDSSGVSMAKADDIAYFLETSLLDRGYENAEVDWHVAGEGDDARILLKVNEGSSQGIRQFLIGGNEALEDPAIVELLTETTRKRLSLKRDDTVPFVPTDLKAGRNKILEFYSLLGHIDAEVELNFENSLSGATVSVTITEGPHYLVGRISLPEAPTRSLEEAFQKTRDEFRDKNFNSAILANIQSRLRSAAVDAGYYEATVTAEKGEILPLEGSNVVEIVTLFEWGAPVQVSGVRVNGNNKTDDAFFERHFDDLVESPYSPNDTNKAVEELLETGAFETIRTDPVKQEDGSFILDVDVEEGYSRTLGIFGGFTNYEGPIAGFEFRNLNLLGSVRTVDAEIEFSKRGVRGAVDYTDPWFLNSEQRFRAGLFAQNREEEGYEKFETGGSYELSKRFGRQERNQIAFFGRASYTDVHDAEIDDFYLGQREYFTHFVGVSLSHDRRDNPNLPRKGFIAQTSASVATSGIGSEIEFFKATGKLGYYLPVGTHTLRLGARAGAIAPMGDTQAIPIDLRFFNGGPFSVRSFQERSLGPIDPGSGEHVGGEFYSVFNAEYEIPIGAFDGLSLVGFADAGNLLQDYDDASLDDMRYAIGAGLRYLTPIGPIRLEYGYNPDQQPGEPQGTMHIGFGFSY